MSETPKFQSDEFNAFARQLKYCKDEIRFMDRVRGTAWALKLEKPEDSA